MLPKFCGKRGILSPLCYESDLKVDGEPGVRIRNPYQNNEKKRDSLRASLTPRRGGLKHLGWHYVLSSFYSDFSFK